MVIIPPKKLRIVRLNDVVEQIGVSKSQYQKLRNCGIAPPAISLGERAVGYLEHEIQAFIKAKAVGMSDEEIKSLISALIKCRCGDFADVN